MTYTGDPIEHFRARQEREQFGKRFAVRAAEAQKGLRRLIEDSEKKEVLAQQVSREMEEFFRDSTRLAGQVFGSISKKKAKKIERKVLLEMEQFFKDLSQQAETLVAALSKNQLNQSQTVKAFEKLFENSLKPFEK